MSDKCETIRVKSTDKKTQGDFILVNKEDYDSKRHTRYEGKIPSGPPPANPKISPAAKKLADAEGVDLSKIEGSGPNGNVVVDDVKKAIDGPGAAVNFASDEAGELAIELGLDAEKLAEIEGTGEDSAITVEDLRKFVDESDDE